MTAWFRLNDEAARAAEDGTPLPANIIDPREVSYINMPSHFTFNKATGKWTIRRRGHRLIGRMYTVSPSETQRYALRLLLLNVKGARSFEHLCTVVDENGVSIVHPTFSEAAKALGLLKDDGHYLQTLREAAQFQMPSELRSVFAAVIGFNEVNDVTALWEAMKKDLSDDYRHRGASSVEAEALAYYDVGDRLMRLSRNIKDIITPPTIPRPTFQYNSYDPVQCQTEGMRLYDTLNAQQKAACDTIMETLDDLSLPRLFFIDGPGGSGKTYLYTTLWNLFVGRRHKVLCTAWTGIAATLLPHGRTAASVFKLDIKNSCKTSSHKRQMKPARLLGEHDVVIWDEASMIPKNALETANDVLQDIMQNNLLFGGKIVILGGDFRQVLPIVKRGSRQDQVDACIKRSVLWPHFKTLRLFSNMRVTKGDAFWVDFLLRVGNGSANDENGRVALPEDISQVDNIVTKVPVSTNIQAIESSWFPSTELINCYH